MKLKLKVILSIFVLLVLIISCKDTGKTEQQSEAIGKSDSLVSGSRNSFLFITEWFDKVGVYKYDIQKKKYKPVWWHPRENVVMLLYKSGKNPSYFLTSDKLGTEGNFPSFSGLKLFIISNDLKEIKQIDKIGDGIQFTARWNDDENLELLFTVVDKTISNYVNQYTKVYDHYGKLIDSEIKTFDMLKNGFPELVPPKISTLSPSGKYGVTIRNDTLFMKTAGSDILEFTTVIKHSLNKLIWSDDEKYLFISTLDLNNETIKTKNPETSELFIYSLGADSLIDSFGGSGVKNFFALNDLLIFDDGFNNNSTINIYDLTQLKVTDIIQPRAGCGLFYIPQL